MKLLDRIQHAWNAFQGDTHQPLLNDFPAYPSKGRRSINPTTSAFASAIYNRIALDVATTTFEHVKEDEKTGDLEKIKSGLNYCLNTEANSDQTNLSFIHDIVYSMFDEGSVAIVPVDTTINPKLSGSFDVNTMRTARLLEFRTNSVKVRVYNDKTGQFQDIWLPKQTVAIIENPLYAVINEPNSTLQRLLTKMNLIDNFDAMVSSGRLDILIQLPFAIRSEYQKGMAKERLESITSQLQDGQHGIAYVDGTEKVVQLNRPANNQLLENVKLLTEQFYNQLGLTANVFNGTASEVEMRNYYNRTVDPIVEFIVKEFERKFLTKTARTQGHRLNVYRNNFKLVPVEQIATLGDTFRRNQIATSNEIRKLVGFAPSNDPLADQLSNPNIAPTNQMPSGVKKEVPSDSVEKEVPIDSAEDPNAGPV
jgi:HK97 family phage portal protein